MADNDLIELTAQIVASHVENNRLNVADVPALIQSVYAALAGLCQPVVVPEVPQEPAVSVRSSVKPDAITCLECGTKQKMLKRHLGVSHDLTPDQYRAKWKLPADYPMTAPDYAAQRKDLALKHGLGTKPVARRGRPKRTS
ncbi:MucR family transcriptional regulator [Sphingomonas montanisoli]|uniref:Transcriptional regulator n=1 Tax=Sphingomonas montanisoli TaxID=2606412 RepID=A0A5D9C1I6_9SPHN|nr:MucR family transcriptional regulator [Sphingomonas montanisoli]TZG25718.1 transcriptional regulator [Sphingomonas montanisoli]